MLCMSTLCLFIIHLRSSFFSSEQSSLHHLLLLQRRLLMWSMLLRLRISMLRIFLVVRIQKGLSSYHRTNDIPYRGPGAERPGNSSTTEQT
jgi:hypothetical protein